MSVRLFVCLVHISYCIRSVNDYHQQLNRRKETMKRTLEQQSRDLNERRRQFEDDKRLFEKEYHEWMEKMESQSSTQLDPKGLVISVTMAVIINNCI